jgi:intracellular sulfur oxidation DsrE/DsrF family protein
MEEEIWAAAEESVDEIKTELEEQVDAYLTTMVEEWKAENQLAVESGLRSEIVEEFLDGLKSLFQEHYIELPSEKVDVVEALTAEVAELTEKLNNSMNSNVDLQIKINEATKNQITGRVCEGLTATQAAKVKTLAEGVEFVTADDYTKKLQVIREGYFSSGTVKQVQPANAIALTESEVPAQDEEEISSSMARYVEAIGRTQ